MATNGMYLAGIYHVLANLISMPVIKLTFQKLFDKTLMSNGYNLSLQLARVDNAIIIIMILNISTLYA